MPEKPLLRLDSYQSGGKIGGCGDDADVGITIPYADNNANAGSAGARPSSSGNDNGAALPSLIARPSPIGRADDDGGVALTDGDHSHFGRWRRWCVMRRRRFAALFCLGGFALLVSIGANSGADIEYNGPASAAASSERDSCPVQSSYFVSSEIMELKNSSSAENVKKGAVATDHPICSRVGVSILRGGGNAADAAVASALCLGVTNPASSGIGGGAFILVHSDARSSGGSSGGNDGGAPPFEDARTRRNGTEGPGAATSDAERDSSGGEKVTEFVDCRESAPRKSTFDMYESEPESSTLGGLAIAVPGELRGLELLHRRHGSMPWEKLVRPAMELARDGFVVETYLAKAIREKAEYIRGMPNLGYILTKNNDGFTLLEEGDVMIRSQYAKTLEAIMHGGADALYEGDLAKMLAKDIQDAGGIITLADIRNYRPVLRDPLIARVAGYNIVGAPPPSSGGGAIIGALRFLSGFVNPYSALVHTLSKHWYVEACRHVFAIRMSLSDPKFAPEENANAVKDLIEGNYMETLRQMTLDDTVLDLSRYGGQKWAQVKDTDGMGALVDAQEGDRRRRMERTHTNHSHVASRNTRLFNYLEDHGTSSLSVVDKDRNTVTITSSINLYFGSKVASPSTGIILNNQMDDFSSPGQVNFFGLFPSESNYIAPGKRALSSMSPTMVFRDNNRDGLMETDNDNLGKLVLSLGASGGPKIITSVLQTILNYAFVGMPLYESISAPRIHNQLLYHGAAGTNVEEDTLPQGPAVRLSERTRAALEKRGHKLIPTDFLGSVQAVAVDSETDSLTAVSDIRKQGMPAGY